MLHEATIHSNGIHTNGAHPAAHLDCASDYEPAPATEAPPPKWRDAWPAYTHNVTWLDSDSKQHSLTIRTDDIHELFGVLKGLKHTIRASKQKAAESAPHTEAPQEAQPDTQRCAIHGVDMPRRWSKRTNGHYFGHKLADGGFCYGRSKS